MKRLIAAAMSLALLLIVGSAGSAPASAGGAAPAALSSTDSADTSPLFTAQRAEPSVAFLSSLGIESQASVTAARCCKICRTGKACGDTCISRSKICHIGPGCACDG